MKIRNPINNKISKNDKLLFLTIKFHSDVLKVLVRG
jgi:hypothetical protein